MVEEFELRSTSAGRSVLGVLVRGTAGGYLRALWFNQPFMRDRFARGQRVLLSGKPKSQRPVLGDDPPDASRRWATTRTSPRARSCPSIRSPKASSSGTCGGSSAACVETYAELLDEVFPPEYLEAHDLWPLRRALPQIHFPSDWQSLEQRPAAVRLPGAVHPAIGPGRSAAAATTQRARARRWRPRPRSTPASAGCSPSS